MNEKQINNAMLIFDELSKSPVSNSALWIGILCVIMKESGLITRTEKSYRNTSNDRIRKIFGRKRLGSMYDYDPILTQAKRNTKGFFNLVYGKRGGNVRDSDGWRFRGRGFNQLTFRGNYRRYATASQPLEQKPWLMNQPAVAARVVAEFFVEQLTRHRELLRKKYQVDPLDVYSTDTAIAIAANINAGVHRGAENKHVKRAFEKSQAHRTDMIALYNAWWGKENLL